MKREMKMSRASLNRLPHKMIPSLQQLCSKISQVFRKDSRTPKTEIQPLLALQFPSESEK